MNSHGLQRENTALRERHSRRGQANLRIDESLDFVVALQEVMNRARSLPGRLEFFAYTD